MSLLVKIETSTQFVHATGSSDFYQFCDTQTGISYKGKFLSLSRIDKHPIFDFRKLDFFHKNVDFSDMTLAGYETIGHQIIIPLEDNMSGFTQTYPNNHVYKQSADERKIEEILNTMGYDLDDIRDTETYNRIIRDLKLKQLIK